MTVYCVCKYQVLGNDKDHTFIVSNIEAKYKR